MVSKRYSKEEIEYLKELYKTSCNSKKICDAINKKFHNGEPVRTPQGVKQKASRLSDVESIYGKREVNGLYYCNYCKEYKEYSEFRSNTTYRDNIHGVCRSCEANYRIYGLPKHRYEEFKIFNKDKGLQR